MNTVILSVLFSHLTFAGDPANVDREGVRRGLENLALRAWQFYYQPAWLGGGGGAFDRFDRWGTAHQLPPGSTCRQYHWLACPSNGIQLVTLDGTGTLVGDDGFRIWVTAYVFPDSIFAVYNN